MKKILAFDCGGTNTRLALINEHLEIEKESRTPTPINNKEKWMSNIISMIQQFSLDNIIAISAGVPGQCDLKNGIITDLSNVHIYNIEFKKILEEKFHLPVFFRNDAEVACLAEAYSGSGKDLERVFFITISTGLGGSLCVKGKIQDYIHEIGHTAYVYKNVVSEYEKLISGVNIANLAKINKIDGISSAKEMFDGVRKNDTKSIKLFTEWKFVLNQFINLVIDTYIPDIICITGGLTKSKDLFLKDIIAAHKNTHITECHYGESAGLIGAAILGLTGLKII